MTRITCFDGVGCIGGNKILLDDNGNKLFFDFGRNFGAEGELYDEFMQPKTVTGLYEHLQMGFLPPFRDLYRQDLVAEVCDPWHDLPDERAGDIGGVIVSHAHVDHIGSIGFLRTEIPVYCSPTTAATARALQDTGMSTQGGEYCYHLARVPNDDGCLASPNYRTHPYTGRKYYLTEPSIPASFTDFWQEASGSRNLEPLEVEHSAVCATMDLRSFPVDHSIYGAMAWAVETGAGWVVYTGDLRTHGDYGRDTLDFAEAVAKLEPVALIIEGTRIDQDTSRKESDVREGSLEVVRDCKGLVVADFGPRNVERLLSFLNVAQETGRLLAILPKDAYLLDALAAAAGDQKVPPLDGGAFRIYGKYSGTASKWQKALLERYSHLQIGPQDVSADQDRFICCFSYWDINELAYIKPVPGSIYIYSTCEPFNEEMQIDADKLKQWIDHFELTLCGAIAEDGQERGDPFHVSGHASGPDLIKIVETIRPKTLIPVHSLHPERYADQLGDICRVALPNRGEPIDL